MAFDYHFVSAPENALILVNIGEYATKESVDYFFASSNTGNWSAGWYMIDEGPMSILVSR